MSDRFDQPFQNNHRLLACGSERRTINHSCENKYSLVDRFMGRFLRREAPSRQHPDTLWNALDECYREPTRELSENLCRCCSLLTVNKSRFRFLQATMFRKDILRLRRELDCFRHLIHRSHDASVVWAGKEVFFLEESMLRIKHTLIGDQGIQRQLNRYPELTLPKKGAIPKRPHETLRKLCDDIAAWMFLELQDGVDHCLFGVADLSSDATRFCFPLTTFDAELSWNQRSASVQIERSVHVHRVSDVQLNTWDRHTKQPMPIWARAVLRAPLVETLLWQSDPVHGIASAMRLLVGNLDSKQVIAQSRGSRDISLPGGPFDPAILFGNVVLCGWDEPDVQRAATRSGHRRGSFYAPPLDKNDSDDPEHSQMIARNSDFGLRW